MYKHKFCPRCGGKLRKSDRKDALVLICSKCAYNFYQNSIPGIGAIIFNKQNQVLLAKRSLEPRKGIWGLVGGFLKYGEKPQICIAREVKEELGVEIKIDKILGVYTNDYESQNEKFACLAIIYTAQISSGEIKLNPENSDYKWFSKNEIPYDNLAFISHNFALKDFFKKTARK